MPVYVATHARVHTRMCGYILRVQRQGFKVPHKLLDRTSLSLKESDWVSLEGGGRAEGRRYREEAGLAQTHSTAPGLPCRFGFVMLPLASRVWARNKVHASNAIVARV